MQLWSNKLCLYFLVVRLASSIPLASQSGPQIPPLPFPADEDISSCHLTPTIKSPTQPWHDASLDPTDDLDDVGGVKLANQSLPLPLSSHQALAPAPIAVTRKRDDQTTAAFNTTTNTICTTIAALTFHNLPINPPFSSRITVPDLTLGPGRYVLSFTNNYRIRLIEVISGVGEHRHVTAHTFDYALSGTLELSFVRTTEVAFLFGWTSAQWPPWRTWLASGEVALFRIGPG